MKICLITNDFPPNIIGGQGIYTYELAKRFTEMGNNVKVIASTNGTLVNEKFDIFSVRRTANPLHFSFLAKESFKKNIHDDIDILHGNAIDHFFFCVRKPRNINKIVTTTQNSYLQRFYAKSLRWKVLHPPLILAEKIIFNRSDRIIAVSEITQEAILKYKTPKTKIDIIYNGVDINKFNLRHNSGILRKALGLENNNKLILFVGRIVKRKNPDVLLNACVKVIKQDYLVHCVFVGKGELEQQLKKMTKEYDLEKNVHFLGFYPHEKLPRIYCDADVLVLPAVGEGLPLVLLEGAASGLPLIATKEASGGAPIIKESENGFFCSINEEDIAKKISVVLEHQEEMSKSSREVASEIFSWTQCAGQTLSSYKKALSDNLLSENNRGCINRE